jgi:hypothetical protein
MDKLAHNPDSKVDTLAVNDQPEIGLLSAKTGADWQDIQRSDDPKSSFAAFERVVLDVLLSPNLVVLCGLGPSLCLKNTDGKPYAPSMAALWAEAAKLQLFPAVIEKTGYSVQKLGENIEQLLSRCQLSQELNPDVEIAAFITQAEKIIVDRCRFVKSGMKLDIHEAFLRKVARRSTRLPRMKLFTTNYDLCFEAAASATRFVVIDGFSHTHPQEFDGTHFGYDLVRRGEEREAPDYIPNVFHLYKIHGSVDWDSDGSTIKRGGEPNRPLLVYPRHSKFELSYNQPFLEMMSRLQIALREPNTGLLIIGFGFSDQHITQPIVSAVRSNVGLKAIVVDPSLTAIPASKTPLLELKSLLDSGDLRLSFVSARFEQFVPLLPDLVAATDEEQHRSRLKKLGGN